MVPFRPHQTRHPPRGETDCECCRQRTPLPEMLKFAASRFEKIFNGAMRRSVGFSARLIAVGGKMIHAQAATLNNNSAAF